VFIEEGTCAIAQSEPASKFTAHRAVVPAIAWLLLNQVEERSPQQEEEQDE